MQTPPVGFGAEPRLQTHSGLTDSPQTSLSLYVIVSQLSRLEQMPTRSGVHKKGFLGRG